MCPATTSSWTAISTCRCNAAASASAPRAVQLTGETEVMYALKIDIMTAVQALSLSRDTSPGAGPASGTPAAERRRKLTMIELKNGAEDFRSPVHRDAYNNGDKHEGVISAHGYSQRELHAQPP